MQIDPNIVEKWAIKFADAADALKVGLVWAGGAHQGGATNKIMDFQRSIGLDLMKPWLNLQGAKFYSLQMDRPSEQIVRLGLADSLIDMMPEVIDFADTAAIIQNLDLVITVDTSVAHLAGGLGKPVWVMSRYNADWRWLQNRSRNPWYPTARIFGQPEMGDWTSVVKKIRHELAAEILKKSV